MSYSTTWALTSSGDIYAWGTNLNGEFGNGTTTTSIIATPQLIRSNVSQISGGNYSATAIISGKLYA